MQNLTPLRVTPKQACELLGISRDVLMRLRKTDNTFPKARKYGNTAQAPVFFDYADLVKWYDAQKAEAEA